MSTPSMPSDSGAEQGREMGFDSRRAWLAGLGGLAAGAILTRSAQAGPLDPPVGPVSPTGSTLDQIKQSVARDGGIAEARRPITQTSGWNITEPGSYYLTENISGAGLVILASDVDLDLNGFTVSNDGGFSAITVYSLGLRNVRIRNGTVRAELVSGGIDGVLLAGVGGTTNSDFVVENLHVSGYGRGQIAGQAGSSVSVNRLIVRRCSLRAVDAIGSAGVWAGGGAIVEDCAISSTGATSRSIGVSAMGGCVVRRCQFSDLGAGAYLNGQSLVSECLFTSVGQGISIQAGDSSRIERCGLFNLRGFGMNLLSRTTVADCTLENVAANAPFGNGIGIQATQRLRLERTYISRAASHGVQVTGFDTVVQDCVFTENAGIGLTCIGPAQIERCHFANNNGAISVDQLTRISQCHLDFNGAFGVRATATLGGVDVVDCTITRHTTGVSIAAASGCAVRRCMFFDNSTAISAPSGNFALYASGAAAANTATNPNINIGV